MGEEVNFDWIRGVEMDVKFGPGDLLVHMLITSHGFLRYVDGPIRVFLAESIAMSDNEVMVSLYISEFWMRSVRSVYVRRRRLSLEVDDLGKLKIDLAIRVLMSLFISSTVFFVN